MTVASFRSSTKSAFRLRGAQSSLSWKAQDSADSDMPFLGHTFLVSSWMAMCFPWRHRQPPADTAKVCREIAPKVYRQSQQPCLAGLYVAFGSLEAMKPAIGLLMR